MQTFKISLFRWPFLCLLVCWAGCSAPQHADGSAAAVCPAGYVRIAPGTVIMGSAASEDGRGDDEKQHSVTIRRAFCMKATPPPPVCPAGYVRIAPSTFTMGAAVGESRNEGDVTQYPVFVEPYYIDRPQHSVTITRAYCMKATEVTQGEWQAMMGSNPSEFKTCGANCPVEQVSWEDAVGYANALSRREGLPECYAGSTFAGLDCAGYRLPTEPEWECAARGGTTTATYLGNLSGKKKEDWTEDCVTAQPSLDGIAWWCRNSGSATHEVGGKTPNAWGLYDMLGNVWEWTGDTLHLYPNPEIQQDIGKPHTDRVFRGGSWQDDDTDARAARRAATHWSERRSNLGFRLAKSVP